MLSPVFRFKLPELGEHRVLHNVLHSFAIERPSRPQVLLSWYLDIVLRHLMSSAFEPLENASPRALTKKTLLLVSLATALRVGEFQALLKRVAVTGDDLMVSYLPHFVAVTERAEIPVPRSFRILSLREFAGDLEEGSILCLVSCASCHFVFTANSVGGG